MSSAFKNRLIGTVVLVALAVILLPDLLDGEKVQGNDRFVSVPNQPDNSPMRPTTPFPHQQVEQVSARQVEVVTEAPVDEPSADVVKNELPPELTEAVESPTKAAEEQEERDTLTALQQQANQPVNEASAGWVVQMGVFRHDKNVQELLKKLEAAGYRAFSRKINTSSGKLTKVFVGPDLQKKKMEEALPHLQELTELKGKVSRFTIH